MTLWGFARAWLALAGRKAIPSLLARFRDFERPEHAPRSPAGTHTCTVVYRRAPACPASESARKKLRPEEECFVFRKKKSFISIDMSYHITSHRITSHQITRHHITSHHIASLQFTSHHFASLSFVSHHFTSLRNTPQSHHTPSFDVCFLLTDT